MFEFTSDCILGIELLDEEHKRLFQLLNEGIETLENNFVIDKYDHIKELLKELENYADQHFAHEEAYMEKICDPELIFQRSQHLYFKEQVRNFSFASIDDLEMQEETLDNLLKFLVKWLYQHILSSDILIGKLPPLEEWMIRENPCEFMDEYRIGMELIDREHEQLFKIIAKVNNMWREQREYGDFDCAETMQLLHELKEYTQFHFRDEEEYMESIQYEGLAAQKRAHDAFINKIENLTEEDLKSNTDKKMQGLVEFLLGWLIQHILHTDKKIPIK